MADPMQVVREMLRVVKPGGYAIAYEADFVVEVSDPPYEGLALINRIWQRLFQNPSGGRRLVNYFRRAEASGIQAGAVIQLEHEDMVVRRIYRLTAEATGPLAVARGILDEAEARTMVDSLVALENDPTAVVTKFPDMWVIATR